MKKNALASRDSLLANRESYVDSFNNLFDNMMKSSFPDFGNLFGVDFFGKAAFPKVDIVAYNNKISIIAEIPGMTKDQIKIAIEDDILTISGDKREDNTGDGKYIVRELKRSSFKRSFRLGEEVDADSIKAKFENGTLVIDIERTEPTEVVRQEIEIE